MSKNPLGITAVLFLLLGSVVHAGDVPFAGNLWEIRAEESRIMEHLGRNALFLKNGLAVVKDSQFTDGVLEYDVAVSGERGFVGCLWRLQDFENYEEFYIRPHQTGQPDANQYEPVFNGQSAWQLYYGEGYGAAVKYEFNQWMHIKIVVSGKRAEVYIQDMQTPVLSVQDQKRKIQAGKVGLSVGNFAPGYFSNFRFTAGTEHPLKTAVKEPGVLPPGTVSTWMVSSVFPEKSLDGRMQLEPPASLNWQKLNSESTGITNLARLHGATEANNTVFARMDIESSAEQVKRLHFGFSDRIKVYFRGRLIYSGDDSYRTRDHRFLGTVGYFDDLYLPLQKGRNELWMAVSEDFGGWGIQARFEDMQGIKLLGQKADSPASGE